MSLGDDIAGCSRRAIKEGFEFRAEHPGARDEVEVAHLEFKWAIFLNVDKVIQDSFGVDRGAVGR